MKNSRPYLLIDLLEQGAKSHPSKTAFVFGKTQVTYKDLDEKCNQLAQQLNILGVKKGDRIGIYMSRALETAIAVYGIMKIGAIFVPLDPKAPADRTIQFIKNCNISNVVTHPVDQRNLGKVKSKYEEDLTLIGSKIEGEISWDKVYNCDPGKLKIDLTELDLAYIMYTSGSTGIPKGIMHTHRSGLSYAELSADTYEVNEEDKIASIAPLHFDQSTFAYFTALYAGATSVIVSEGQMIMLESLSRLIDEENISILYTVPLVFIQLQERKLIKKFAQLRWILFGGEVYPPKKFNELITDLPHVKFSNVYGPAEVNQCTYKHIDRLVDEHKTIPLGKVWANTTIKIIDENNQETNTEGELLVRSATMMKGYWNNKTLNESAFYQDLTEDVPTKFYRTGDLVKHGKNGELIFIGRKDRQVKIRGQRVELSELENKLNLLENLVETAAFTIEEDNEKVLCAVVCSALEEKYSVSEIKRHLGDLLPKYYIPTHIRQMITLPRTKNGKVDYQAIIKSFSSQEKVLEFQSNEN